LPGFGINSACYAWDASRSIFLLACMRASTHRFTFANADSLPPVKSRMLDSVDASFRTVTSIHALMQCVNGQKSLG
jgi:hypothetical protein